jgi:GNAT superfamily N-acetyltransferase
MADDLHGTGTAARPALPPPSRGPDAPEEHLAAWLDGWPPSRPVHVVVDPTPELPGWDGGPRGITGVASPDGRAVVRVPSAVAARLPRALPDVAALLAALPSAAGRPGHAVSGVLRWAQQVPSREDVPEVGVWLPASLAAQGDPQVPAWLRPFGGDVLVALDEDGTHLAGVGIKRHTDSVHELAVVTVEAARGRGLARGLVAQAARAVQGEGRAVLYLHAPDNEGSARVARASGFPDTGWRVLGFFPSS